MENKDLIIQDLKNVIIDYRNNIDAQQKQLFRYENYLNNKEKNIIDLKSEIIELNKTSNKLLNEQTVINNEKQFKLINDLNICQFANKRQSEIIKELQLENSEVNKLLSTYKFSFYLIASIVTVVSVIGSIITLIK